MQMVVIELKLQFYSFLETACMPALVATTTDLYQWFITITTSAIKIAINAAGFHGCVQVRE